MTKIKISVSFFWVLMVGALIFTHSYISLAALLAAAIHELGHIFAAKICSIPLYEMKLGIFGAALTTDASLCPYKKEIILAAAGPLVNLISSTFLYPLLKSSEGFGAMFLSASLFLGLLNLLPVESFDGGRILNCFLCEKFSPRVASAVCGGLSFITVISLWLLSVYLLLRRSSSLSLFVFSLSLFCKIFITQKN